MTRRLRIIGGGIQGTMSAFAVAKAGAFSEIIATEIIGLSCPSHYSAGQHFPSAAKTLAGRSLENAQWPWWPLLGRRSAEGTGPCQ